MLPSLRDCESGSRSGVLETFEDMAYTSQDPETMTNILHSYKDKAALGAHGSSKTFKAFQKKMQDEDLVGGPMQVRCSSARPSYSTGSCGP